jgi:predicted metal-dependent peptidase
MGLQNPEYTAQQRVERTHVRCMQIPKLRFFGSMLLHGETIFTDEVPTAATDGINTYYNPVFVQTLDDKELMFVVLHECMHKVYKHLFIWKKLREKYALLTNMANDYVINPMIRDLDPDEKFLRVPRYKEGPKKGMPACLLDDQFINMDTKQVVDILLLENEEKQGTVPKKGKKGVTPPPVPPGKNGPCPPGGYPIPPNDDDDNETEEPEEDEEKFHHSNKKGPAKYSEKIKKRAEDQHDDHNYDEEKTAEELEKTNNELDRAIRQAAEVAGTGSDGIAKAVVKLLAVETPWQEILAEFIKQQVKGGGQTTWRKYNRRLIGSDIYMPSMLDEKAGQMVVAMDTSGSVFSDIDKFLSEFKTIAMDVMPEKVHLVYWDYSVQGEETYDEMSYANLEDSTKPIGGGGTDPSCVFRQVEDKILTGEYQDINAVIIFTDGYFYGDIEGDWEKLGIPVLWAVIERGGNSEFIPTFGSLITIK